MCLSCFFCSCLISFTDSLPYLKCLHTVLTHIRCINSVELLYHKKTTETVSVTCHFFFVLSVCTRRTKNRGVKNEASETQKCIEETFPIQFRQLWAHIIIIICYSPARFTCCIAFTTKKKQQEKIISLHIFYVYASSVYACSIICVSFVILHSLLCCVCLFVWVLLCASCFISVFAILFSYRFYFLLFVSKKCCVCVFFGW